MNQGEGGRQAPTQRVLGEWPLVLEAVLPATETFRALIEGSTEMGVKSLTEGKRSETTTQVNRRVTLMHAVGSPEGAPSEWLSRVDLPAAVVTMRSAEPPLPAASSAGVESPGAAVRIHIGMETRRAPVTVQDSGQTVGPFVVPGDLIGQPRTVAVQVSLRNIHLDLTTEPLLLVVVDIAPYLNGRDLLLAR